MFTTIPLSTPLTALLAQCLYIKSMAERGIPARALQQEIATVNPLRSALGWPTVPTPRRQSPIHLPPVISQSLQAIYNQLPPRSDLLPSTWLVLTVAPHDASAPLQPHQLTGALLEGAGFDILTHYSQPEYMVFRCQ